MEVTSMNPRENFDRIYRSLILMDMIDVEAMADKKLSYRDIFYLDLIMLTPECTVSKLSEALRVSPPSVTRRVNSMEERGLVVRKRQEGDARFKTIEISDEFRKAMDDPEGLVDKVFAKLPEEYSEEDVELFCDMLGFVADNLDTSVSRRRRRSRIAGTAEGVSVPIRQSQTSNRTPCSSAHPL